MQQGLTDINVEMYLSSIIIRTEDGKCLEDTDCFVIFFFGGGRWNRESGQRGSGESDQQLNAPWND